MAAYILFASGMLVSLSTGFSGAQPAFAAPARQAATGDISGWGQFWDAQKSPKSHAISTSPQQVAGLGDVIAIQGGNSDDYALLADGTEEAWGYGRFAELGDGSSSNSFTTPVTVTFPSGTTITAIGEAKDDGFAVDSDGNGWTWGLNAAGELCTGNTRSVLTPEKVSLPSAVTAVAGGDGHVEWLATDGAVYTCGAGKSGQLGDGAFNNSATAVQVVGLPVGDPVVSISSGEGTQAALTASGTLWMWGEGAHGALGDGSTANADAPMQVPGQWSAVSDGGSNSVNNHAVAITTSGVVEAWGANSFGQLGDGTLTKSSQPVSVMVPAGVSFTKVLAGGSESGAIDTNGHVWMWGGDRYGELGDGSKVGSRRTPIEVDSEKTMLSGTSRNVVDG